MGDFPSRLDLYAIGRDYVTQRAKKIDPFQVDVLGSDVNIFVGLSSQIAFAIVLQLAFSVNRLLLDGAEKEDLDRYAWDRYQLTRKGASAALGQVSMKRVDTSAAGTVPAGTKLLTLSDIEYITTTSATFIVGQKEQTAFVRAVQAGKSTQVGKNNIRKFATPTQIFDQKIQLNNFDRTAGGEDIEDDPTFRNRIRGFFLTARRGTIGAIEFGATQVDGVVSAKAVEAITTGGMPARVVMLYISDSSGVANEALARSVRAALDEFRAAGIAVLVFTGQPVIIDIKLKLMFGSNVDTDTLRDLVLAAVVEYVNSLPVNGTLELSAIMSVLVRYRNDGLLVNDQTIVSPAGDIVPTIGTSLRTSLNNVTAVAA